MTATGTPARPDGYRGASAAAIQHHYDLSNDFYALWLDPSMTYSCGLWEDGSDTLELAQRRKHDYLARESGAIGARRVLDIGFGWGALLSRLVDTHGVRQVSGLTLSRAQADLVAARGDERYDLHVEGWAEHEPEEGYDAIISIGAFEHFADSGLKRDARVAGYRDFFARCRSWLPLGGRLAVQSITKGSNVALDRDMTREMLFVNRYIFPESEVPWPSEMFEAAERMFETRTVRHDGAHYARTCGTWLENLRARRSEAEAMVGPDTVAGYERYLAACVRAFDNRHVGLLRAVFERVV